MPLGLLAHAVTQMFISCLLVLWPGQFGQPNELHSQCLSQLILVLSPISVN